MSTVFDEVKWFEMWLADKESILVCMRHNIEADLNAGYDPEGVSIRTQKAEMRAYEEGIESTLSRLTDMAVDKGIKAVNRWCYMDMKRRGAI